MPQVRHDQLNREGHEDFAVRWSEPTTRAGSSLTAVLRVKNEARNLPWVLPPLFACVDEMVIVDNGSDDGTAEIAVQLAAEHEFSQLRMLSYPFLVSRCGTEHLATRPDSVHSLTYFYNWAFSHVSTRYALKWDGDMVLSEHGQQLLRDFAWQSETADLVLHVPRHSVYLIDGSEAWVDVGIQNLEQWAWPNLPEYHFGKGPEWEIQLRPEDTTPTRWPQGVCFELKWLDADEFDHWTSRQEFGRAPRTARKAREAKIFDSLKSGDAANDQLIRLTPNDGQAHVIERIQTIGPSEWNALSSGSPARS